jgi:hypothetical protein
MGGCHDALEVYWAPKLSTVYLVMDFLMKIVHYVVKGMLNFV